MVKPYIFVITLLLYVSFPIIDSSAQSTETSTIDKDVVNYKNSNSRNYAIASAKEIKKAYEQCKAIFEGYYVNRYYRLTSRAHVDTAYQFLLKATHYNKKAYGYNRDTLNLGADYLYKSEQNLLQAQTYLYGILNARKEKDIQYYGEVAMFYFGHGAADAYRASMHLQDGRKLFDKIPSEQPVANKQTRYKAKPLFGEATNTDNEDEKIENYPEEESFSQQSAHARQKGLQKANNSPKPSDEIPETISLDQLEKLLNTSEADAHEFIESVSDKGTTNDDEASRNISRLESDEAAFSALKYTYEKKVEESRKKIEELKSTLNSAKSSKEKRKITREIEQEETYLADYRKKLANADGQLAEIKKALGKGRKSYQNSKNFPTEEEVARNIDYPLNPKLPSGLLYKVQIGYYPWKKEPLFKGEPVEQESLVIAQLDGWNLRYLTGEYTKYNEAAFRRDVIQKKYVNDAFVVAFYNGRKINMYEALKIENEN